MEIINYQHTVNSRISLCCFSVVVFVRKTALIPPQETFSNVEKTVSQLEFQTAVICPSDHLLLLLCCFRFSLLLSLPPSLSVSLYYPFQRITSSHLSEWSERLANFSSDSF